MRKIQIVFIVAFLAIVSVPIVLFNPNQKVAVKENRPMANMPTIIKNGKLNSGYFDQLSLFVKDHFGGRSSLISISNFFDYKVLRRERITQFAFQGDDGWLYFTEPGRGNTKDFLKKNLFSAAEKDLLSQNIMNAANFCKENGIKCLFIIGPNKHCIYPEHYSIKRPEGMTRADQIVSIFEENNLPYVYSRDTLIARKEKESIPLYFETDTHWNNLGAYISFQEIYAKLKELFPESDFPKIEYDMSVSTSTNAGDLLAMLDIESLPCTQVAFTPKNGDEGFEYIKNEGRQGVITKGKSDLPKVILFRDSYFNALMPFFSPCFSNAEYNWWQFSESDKDYVLKNKPDLVVFENVERDSNTIVCDVK